MSTEAPLEGEKTLLILDDDAPFRTRLARALEQRGFEVTALGSVAEATVRFAPCPVLVVREKEVPAPVPAIQPPCPRCVEARKASGGKEFWCEQHRERHGQRHTYHQDDRLGSETNMPLVMRS